MSKRCELGDGAVTNTLHAFAFRPQGPFNLLHQNKYFNGWPLTDDGQKLVMAFPVEGWHGSAAVTLQQNRSGDLQGEIYGPPEIRDQARQQALAAMSLDEDGTEWAAVGKRDPVVAALQREYDYMRPTLFHSPYEAAAAFIIGHRISIAQGRKLRATMASELGERIEVSGELFFAFPSPQKLLALEGFKGLNETKISRLHAVARGALEGLLDRGYLRSLDDEISLTRLETLPGIGPFFSQGILFRGAGKRDGFTQDDTTYRAIRQAYDLGGEASADALLAIAEPWRPYRMWAIVLLHVWVRETVTSRANRA